MEHVCDFSLDYMSKCMNAGENFFISPLSIYTTLSMLLMGANKGTADQLKEVLAGSTEIDLRNFHIDFTKVLKELNESKHPKSILSIANGLFPDEKFTMNDKFVKDLSHLYETELIKLSYAKSAEATKAINSWVEKKTKDKIKNLIPDGVLSASTQLVLANAVYFKCPFSKQFEKNATKDEHFHVSATKKVLKPMMVESGDYDYIEKNGLRLLSIPFEDYHYRLVIGLPSTRFGIDEALKKMTGKKLLDMLNNMTDVTVTKLKLPRFKLETNMDLKESLQKLGLVDMFDPIKADLSGITRSQPIYVGYMIHNSKLVVAEQGVEMAAGTAAKTNCLFPRPVEKRKIEYITDEPFLVMIYNRQLKCVLSKGRIQEP